MGSNKRVRATDGSRLHVSVVPVDVDFDAVAARVVELAKTGDVGAARQILAAVVSAIPKRESTWRGVQQNVIPWAYARYLADCFGAILNDIDPRAALHLVGSAGRPEGSGDYDLEALAAAYNVLLFAGLKPKQAKSYMAEYIKAQGNAPPLSARTIEKANAKHGTYAAYLRYARSRSKSDADRQFAAEIMRSGALRYAAEIESILAARELRAG